MTDFEKSLNNGLTQGMATYAAERGLPALNWSVRVLDGLTLVAHIGRADYANHERVLAAEMWAAHMGFTEADKVEHEVGPMRHTIEWRGTFEGYPLTLWTITDEDAWEEAAAEGPPYSRDQQK